MKLPLPSQSYRPLLLLASALVLAAATGVRPLGAQGLSPAIQVDRYRLQAERQMESGDYAAALETLEQVLTLQAEHELELPEGFWVQRAEVALEAEAYDIAITSATRYLEVAGQEGEDYTAALELLLDAEERRLAEERRAELSRPGRVFRDDCAGCPEMVVVPSGSYMMGSPASEAGRNGREGPRHRVTIGYPLAVGVYEVTFAEWDACVRAGGCAGSRPEDEGWGRGRRPVINVSWEDVQAYVAWLSSETGEEYRLLSESEWEYVARAGTQTARHWGASSSGQCGYANGYDRTGDQKHDFSWDSMSCSDGYADTAPVGSFEPNAFGLYDVSGNVWEWVEDCWNGDYEGAPTDGGAWRTGDCSQRVLRGGSWYYDPDYLRSAYRDWLQAGDRNNYLGFRLARTIN